MGRNSGSDTARRRKPARLWARNSVSPGSELFDLFCWIGARTGFQNGLVYLSLTRFLSVVH